MRALVVYESLWGNTAEIARAIAEGIGPEAQAVSTRDATNELLTGAELIVAGAPVLAFSLPTEKIRSGLVGQPGTPPPDLSSPSMRQWLDTLPKDSAGFAAFETRVRFSPGGSTSGIEEGMQRAGYHRVAKSMRFFVKGRYGPLRDGEAERARRWGSELAAAAAR